MELVWEPGSELVWEPGLELVWEPGLELVWEPRLELGVGAWVGAAVVGAGVGAAMVGAGVGAVVGQVPHVAGHFTLAAKNSPHRRDLSSATQEQPFPGKFFELECRVSSSQGHRGGR